MGASVTKNAAKSEKLIDNSRVIVTRWTLAPGDEIPQHRHEKDYVVVPMTGGALTITTAAGKSQGPLQKGVPYARERGVEHVVANEGSEEIVFIEIEIN